ncbi:hypothetical protein C8F01DRAFT_1108754 [Mycena amicta]|nr:hypothetical protein C8F01DRAFT_1108754 [Mycena amicta]
MSLPLPTTRYDPQLAQLHLRSSKPRFNLFHRRTSSSPPPPNVSIAALPLAGPDPLIDVDFPPYENDEEEYHWACLYENQRGLKIFSTAYYSYSSLLPTDPQPFTVPVATSSRIKQPDVSLDSYPLPDGSYLWQSPWMVDMRNGDTVQPDGFSYNMFFRQHHWHPEAGPFSWVRRRRWIRLMVRPKRKVAHKAAESPNPNTPQEERISQKRVSLASSLHTSVLDSFSGDEVTSEEFLKQIWVESDVEENYRKYRRAITLAGTDGRLLEFWRQWLGLPQPQDDKGKRKQWTEDEEDSFLDVPVTESRPSPPPPPPIDNILPTLRDHGEQILQSFIYPESRTRFREMLESIDELKELSMSDSNEFWSYR